FGIPFFIFCVVVLAMCLWITTDINIFRRAETFFMWALFILLIGVKMVGELFLKTSNEREQLRTLVGLSLTNATRRRGRSMLFIALVASTTFLVLSISAFRLDPMDKSNTSYRSGSGGFVFIGETTFPVYHNVGTVQGREGLAIQPDDETHLEQSKIDIVAFRTGGGDNASCLNLFQTGNPRILGVPVEALKKRRENHSGSFHFAKPRESYSILESSNWRLLQRPITIDPDGIRRVPVIIDQNTAMYALHLYGGIGDVYELNDGPNDIIRCEVVGLLSNSVMQGDILMCEKNFLQLFPEVNGYQFFLFGFPSGAISQQLDDRTLRIIYDLLGDYGFQGESTSDRLRKLFAVQNTYLSTFQSLGGIGLLLGIFGLAVIQSRNVLERRKELALLQAVGFTKRRTIWLLLYESFTLLAWGLGLAVVASTFALLPFLIGGVEQISPMSVLRQFVVLVGSLLAVGIVSNVAAALAVLRIPVARELAEER
ncbi:MAG: hypothetical protein FWE95_09510, partial [Planctomycetaceae bacterium]|nr:hypothetical protein [Planctomycetaceae bacterium]